MTKISVEKIFSKLKSNNFCGELIKINWRVRVEIL